MRAAVWDGSVEGVQTLEVEVRPLGRTDVLVEITATAACITTVVSVANKFPPDGPTQIPGHGGVGVVREVGPDVRRVRVGDTVLLGNPWCGVCYACAKGRADQCSELVFAGKTHTLADGRAVHAESNIGAYAEQAVVPEIQVAPLHTTAPHEALALLADSGGGALGAAFLVAPLRPGAIVGVVGCGVMGLSYVQAARMVGAERIIALDPRPDRRAAALLSGATDVLDSDDPDVVEKAKELAGGFAGWGDRRGVEFAFEAAGDSRAVQTAFAITRPTGDIVLGGVPHDYQTASVTFSVVDLAMYGKRIHPCQWGETNLLRDMPRWARLIEDGRLPFDQLVGRTYGIEQANDALSDVGRYQVLSAVLTPGR